MKAQPPHFPRYHLKLRVIGSTYLCQDRKDPRVPIAGKGLSRQDDNEQTEDRVSRWFQRLSSIARVNYFSPIPVLKQSPF